MHILDEAKIIGTILKINVHNSAIIVLLIQVKIKTCCTSGFWKNRRKRAFLFFIFYWKTDLNTCIWHYILSIQWQNDIWEKKKDAFFICLFWEIGPSTDFQNSRICFNFWNIFYNELELKVYKMKRNLKILQTRRRAGRETC